MPCFSCNLFLRYFNKMNASIQVQSKHIGHQLRLYINSLLESLGLGHNPCTSFLLHYSFIHILYVYKLTRLSLSPLLKDLFDINKRMRYLKSLYKYNLLKHETFYDCIGIWKQPVLLDVNCTKYKRRYGSSKSLVTFEAK